jgi:DNA-binding NarL/FixJ family response regulator
LPNVCSAGDNIAMAMELSSLVQSGERRPGDSSGSAPGALPTNPEMNRSLDGLGVAKDVMHITVIDANTLARSCLARCLVGARVDFSTTSYASVQAWQQAHDRRATAIVLLCAVGEAATQSAAKKDVAQALHIAPESRVIVVSDREEPALIVDAIDSGAKGYISMSSSLDVVIAAINLIKAGGTFIPASGMLAPHQNTSAYPTGGESLERIGGRFTDRQLEVIKLVRQGKPNKIIAYELNMGECTVKVHIRNIMRKVNARNRTEVLFLTNELFETA